MIINFSNIGGGSGSGSTYVLPTATASRLGGVKIGSGISVENDGTISVSGGTTPDLSGYTTTAVTAELSAATSGIAVDLQSLSAYTETIPTGSTYELPIASNSTLGGVKIGNELSIDSAGTLSVKIYDLDNMTQQERADLVQYFSTLTAEEKEEIRVYRDKVICSYQGDEGSGSSYKIKFFEYREDGWSVPVLRFRHFSVKSNGAYEVQSDTSYANIIEFYTTYTGHSLSQNDGLSPLNPISDLGSVDGRIAISIRMIVQNNPTFAVSSSSAWAERGEWPGGYICGIWHYSGNVITAKWRVWENSATIESWTETPENPYQIVSDIANITSPFEGLMAYDTTAKTFNVYSNSTWNTVSLTPVS